jgi:hypothetical protein
MATPAVTANRIALGALLVAVLALAWTAVGTEVMSALRDPTGAITAPADGTTIVGPNVGVDGTAARTPRRYGSSFAPCPTAPGTRSRRCTSS